MLNIKHSILKNYIILLLAALIPFYMISCKDKDNEPVKTDKDEIVTIMKNTQAERHVPGWIVGVKTPTMTYKIAYGKADLNAGMEISTSDLLRIGSITKTFTATLVLILCDEGSLHLNDKLENYLPDFPNADQITVRQLLMHTSGIVSWDEDEDIRIQIFNGTGDWTIDKLIEWAALQEFHFEPGTAYHYSNIGYFILGKIIEQTTNLTVASALEEKICLPLGLNSTFMAATPHPTGETIHGYDESGGTIVDMTGTPQADAINFELAWTAGGMLSTLKDLTTWAKAVSNGELLSDSLHIQQMPVLNPPSQHFPYWSGYGMGIAQTDVWLGHTGAVCGYICNLSYYPEKDVTIIAFFNKFSAFDLDQNTADLVAISNNFMELARYLCPETLQPEN